MKLVQAITADKIELIDRANKLYRDSKDNLGLEFGEGRIGFGDNYFLTIPGSNEYTKPYAVIELFENIEFDSQNYAVSYRVKPWINNATIRIDLHNEDGHVSMETILHLGEYEIHLLDKHLHQDALFYTCYEKVIQYLIEESPNDIDRIKRLLYEIKRLKNDRILSFSTREWHDYTLLVNDDKFRYKQLESTNTYAPILIGDYIKDRII